MASKSAKLYVGVFFFLSTLSTPFLNTESLASDKRTSLALTRFIIAGMYDRLEEPEKAIREYKKALKLDYKNSVIHFNLASVYLKNNQTEEAIKELKLATDFNPDAVEPHLVLALIYSIQNSSELATEEYEAALKNASKSEPQNIDIYRNLGIVYLRQKKYVAAENTYRLILELSPGDAQAHFYLGNIYEELKKRDRAIDELKEAIELDPNYHEALNYLGYLYVEENKNLDSAEIMIRKALELDADNGAYVDSLGWLYFKQGKFKEALLELERASMLLSDPVIYDHLGDVYLKVNDLEKARASWENSLGLDPKQEAVKEKIGSLK